ncbi:MAG: hypothetical protein ACKVWV_08590 [Planctomycetota bacterium]
MSVPRFHRVALAAASASALFIGNARAQLVGAPGQIPQGNPFNNSSTENVDFADVDLDGDWDAAFADGGDSDQDQNRIWINLGHAQSGTIGFFADETATRCPVILDQSRDIEFVDFDADSDADISVSNTSQIFPQTNRWWRNNGPAPATSGFYVDETAARWIGLGGAGSSVPSIAVLAGGGFIDWSCDCDFGDLDNDGDLDLVHSTYGGAFGGQVPTRMFLNDGSGHFAEFNPSGFQLTTSQITNGSPGLWCSGTHQSNTTVSDGSRCDIAMTALDIEIGDVDGDLDLDLLHGSRGELPRMFRNLLEENGGVLTAFRDVAAATFPPNYAFGGGHYAQELGDFDDDGDLDVYGLNWLGFSDGTFLNDGDGTYCCTFTIPNSGNDDNEGDFFDYENDGDLDLFIAAFGGPDHVFQNTNGSGGWTLVPGLSLGSGSLDADTADIDDDGDTDAMSARDGGGANALSLNVTTADDTFAPRLHRLEQAPDRAAGPAPTVVRVQVYDNASYYTTWYADTRLEVQVNGGPTLTFPMRSSQGQVFRGEIPGELAGTIAYRAVSTDEHGNTGSTPFLDFVVNGVTSVAYCFGDGSLATPCPCAPPNVVPNPSGAPGHGCANSFSLDGAHLSANGTLTPDTLTFTGDVAAVYSGFAFLIKGNATTAAGIASGDGVRCVSGDLVRFGGHNAGTNGAPLGIWTYPNDVQTVPVSVATAQAAGATAHYQLFYRNAAANFCSAATTNLSNALAIDWP